MTIERKGETKGRKVNYLLIVDGVSVGRIQKKRAGHGGVLLGKASYAVWQIFGLQVGTQEEAERELIARAQREGRL